MDRIIETFYQGKYRIIQTIKGPCEWHDSEKVYYTVQEKSSVGTWTTLCGGNDYGQQRITCRQIIKKQEYGELFP